MNDTIPSLSRYETHLRATIAWLNRSIEHGNGGSCAHFSFFRGWSSPYPETSGYIVPTLLATSNHLADKRLYDNAVKLGEWLLELQSPEGWWPGGLLRKGTENTPSVFNSAQIIDGMAALARHTGDNRWLVAVDSGAGWLAKNVDAEGLWQVGNYRKGVNPSYYTQVAWPMLQVWELTSNDAVKKAALRALRRIMALKTENGMFSNWGFDTDKPAFTHTIAYTLRGFIESALILDEWEEFGKPCLPALEKFARKAELNLGKLPGAYYEDWRAVNWYSCLTGNVQIAICLLRLEQQENDLRLVNSAAKLVDYVCSCQKIQGGLLATRGAVPGSSPIFGRYMFMRYPNWAAKYLADALIMLRKRLIKEIIT